MLSLIITINKLLNINSSNNKNYKNVSKKELFNKLSKLSLKQLEDINLNVDEINYLKNKILNDKLGLVLNFEEKDEYLDNHYFGLEEIKELHIDPKEKNNHLLIEGDNYYALKALQISGIKVDVIYIDPPYNTGNKDFIYNDSFVEKDDQFKHSKWLSFMKKRLELARELLADDGIIFISIDDNEQAYLKVLMDEIFGEENFVANFLWKCRTSRQYSEKFISTQTDYILSYCKNKNFWEETSFNRIFDIVDIENYKNLDNDSRGPWTSSGIIRNDGRKEYEIVSPTGKVFKKAWLYTRENMDVLIKNNLIWWGAKGDSIPRKKNFLKDVMQNGVVSSNILQEQFSDFELKKAIENKIKWDDDYLNSLINFNSIKSNDFATKQLHKIISKNEFEQKTNSQKSINPKPVELIKFLLKLYPKFSFSILDFFAGSGTTAQAIMELNEEDGGNRRFILCTNNENNIAQDICRERIYRVINGQGSKKEKIDWEYSKDKKSLNDNSMKYLRIKPIHNVNGEYEEINDMKNIYKNEFNKELSIKDFK